MQTAATLAAEAADGTVSSHLMTTKKQNCPKPRTSPSLARRLFRTSPARRKVRRKGPLRSQMPHNQKVQIACATRSRPKRQRHRNKPQQPMTRRRPTVDFLRGSDSYSNYPTCQAGCSKRPRVYQKIILATANSATPASGACIIWPCALTARAHFVREARRRRCSRGSILSCR